MTRAKEHRYCAALSSTGLVVEPKAKIFMQIMWNKCKSCKLADARTSLVMMKGSIARHGRRQDDFRVAMHSLAAAKLTGLGGQVRRDEDTATSAGIEAV